MNRPKRAIPLPRCRSSIVTRVPSPAGSSRASTRRSASTFANGVPSISCAHARDRPASCPSSRQSARTARPRDERRTAVQPSPVTPFTRSTRGHQRASARGSATSFHTASGAAGSVRERVTITRRS